jgi:putative copper resistance protein D
VPAIPFGVPTTLLLPLANALLFVGLTLAIGAVVYRFGLVTRAAVPADERQDLARRAATGGLGGVLLITVSLPTRAVAQAVGLAFPGDPLMPLLVQVLRDSAVGELLAVQATAALLAAGAFSVARRDVLLAWLAAAGAVTVLAISVGLGGHAATAASPAVSVTAAALHTLAAGAWIGTLVHLWRSSNTRSQATLVERFHVIALTAAAVVVVSGVTQLWDFVRTPQDLISSQWGVLFLAKIALVAVTMALGHRHWRGAVAQLRAGGATVVRRTVAIEVVVALAILLLSAVLTTTSPPDAG